MYYLQSRYYDPTTCRFINADAYTSTGQGILGHNMFAYCENNPVMGYDPTGAWSWGIFAKIVATTVVVAACLTVVGAIAATAAAAAAVSTTAAVTTAVATASVSIACSAVDGAICAEQSGGKWYDGAMAGAIGGSVGVVVSSLTNPMPGSDSALRMNILGRSASSFVYDLTYELFDTGEITEEGLISASVDVVMDATLSPTYYFYNGNVKNGYVGSFLNGLGDSIVDVFQTVAYFS